MAAKGFAHFSPLDSCPRVTVQQSLLRKCTLRKSCLFISTRDCLSCSKNDFIQLNTANFLYFTLIYLKHCEKHRAEELNVAGEEAVWFPQGMAHSIIYWGSDFLKGWIQEILGFQSSLYLTAVWSWMDSQSQQMLLLHWPPDLLKCPVKGQCLLFIQCWFFVQPPIFTVVKQTNPSTDKHWVLILLFIGGARAQSSPSFMITATLNRI